MKYEYKIPLTVHRDKVNKWFYIGQGRHQARLAWDSRKEWFWLEVYAKRLGKKDFIKDLTEILTAMEKDKQAPFTLYVYPKIQWVKSDTPLSPDQQ